jgi:NAD(P)-dependent dehydrogenase (short-subunit alcohol dehydrogenase family)
MDWLGLAGRNCIVTGAGGGIGSMVARTFAEAGARLVLLD